MYDRHVPRLIDHDERDRQIGDAAWRVLTRDGLVAFSVRNVAEEAGIATASLRRAYPTQDALRVACLRRAAARVQERMDAVFADPSLPAPEVDPLPLVTRCLEQLLPLDDERRTETEVFLTLGSVALTDDGVRAAWDEADRAVRSACASLLALLTPPGTAGGAGAAAVDERRVARLHALLDGLALHLAHRPRRDDAGWARELLVEELTRLRAEAGRTR